MSDYGLLLRTFHIEVQKDGFPPEYDQLNDAAPYFLAAEDYTIEPNEKKILRTGCHIKYPDIEFAMVYSPMPQLLLEGLMLFDNNRIIDSWDNTELHCMIWNTTDEPKTIKRGQRIFRGAIVLTSHASFVDADTEYVTSWKPEDELPANRIRWKLIR
jgi:dUTPase